MREAALAAALDIMISHCRNIADSSHVHKLRKAAIKFIAGRSVIIELLVFRLGRKIEKDDGHLYLLDQLSIGCPPAFKALGNQAGDDVAFLGEQAEPKSFGDFGFAGLRITNEIDAHRCAA